MSTHTPLNWSDHLSVRYAAVAWSPRGAYFLFKNEDVFWVEIVSPVGQIDRRFKRGVTRDDAKLACERFERAGIWPEGWVKP